MYCSVPTIAPWSVSGRTNLPVLIREIRRALGDDDHTIVRTVMDMHVDVSDLEVHRASGRSNPNVIAPRDGAAA